MKKYIKPILEVLKISDCAQLMENTNQNPWADAKENNMFLFDDEEFDDENDLWNNNSHKDDYNLWEE